MLSVSKASTVTSSTIAAARASRVVLVASQGGTDMTKTARSSVQQGFAQLVAQYQSNKTVLTKVVHKSPTRLLPITSSVLLNRNNNHNKNDKNNNNNNDGAALCAIGSYGGGMVQGDVQHVSVTVESRASLGVTTQGPNRIFKTNRKGTNQGGPSHSQLDVTVQSHGLCVIAPDPNVLFTQSELTQNVTIQLQDDTASCIVLDWYAAGRVFNGEVWNHSYFSSTTTLNRNNHLLLTDRVVLDNRNSTTTTTTTPTTTKNHTFWGGTKNKKKENKNNSIEDGLQQPSPPDERMTAMCNIVLAGPKSHAVAAQLQAWSSQLTSQQTSIRRPKQQRQQQTTHDIDTDNDHVHEYDDDDDDTVPHMTLSHDGTHVYCGVTAIPEYDVHVARIAAQSNEDIYRILHNALRPLNFGLPFYKERLSAQSTLLATPPPSKFVATAGISSTVSALDQQQSNDMSISSSVMNPTDTETQDDNDPSSSSNSFLSDPSIWSAFMLVDSGLPTGSFAHSSGLEVAHQFGLLRDEDSVEQFVLAATQSALQLATPFVVAAHQSVVATSTAKAPIDNAANSHHHDQVPSWLSTMLELDRQCHALLVSNRPASQASMDQGNGLLRVALAWSKTDQPQLHTMLQLLQQQQDMSPRFSNHLAPMFGFLTANFGILTPTHACRILQYTMARDIISAAVRLNVIGPLASVPMLQRVAATTTITPTIPMVVSATTSGDMTTTTGDVQLSQLLEQASSTAPLLDVLHPCHDLLAVRLFRT